MYNEEELSIFRPPCQFIEGKFIPCTVVISHLEALAEIEVLKKRIIELKDKVVGLEEKLKGCQ